MATIKRYLQSKVNAYGESEVMLRLSVCRGCVARLHTGLYVRRDRWRDGGVVKPRANRGEAERLLALEGELAAMEGHVLRWVLSMVTADVTVESVRVELERYRRERAGGGSCEGAGGDTVGGMVGGMVFVELAERYIAGHELSASRVAQMRMLGRSLGRFCEYAARVGGHDVRGVDELTRVDLEGYEEFLHAEERVWRSMPDLYEKFPHREVRGKGRGVAPRGRSRNYVAGVFSRLRALYNWAVEVGITENNPAVRFRPAGGGERYGRPYFLTYEECAALARADLSGNEGLSRQRDVFLFQCLVGCRVSDLRELRRGNVVDGVLVYIPRKTVKGGGDVVRVPLTEDALEILARYPDNRGGRLLPCITDQRYNKAIKEIFRVCGLTRMVPVLDRNTGEKTLRPLNEIASSHIARRTLIGNLYRQLKDPNLIGEITGHRNGSVSFRRYRDVDDEVKRDVLGLIPRIF